MSDTSTTSPIIRARGLERTYRQGSVDIHALRGIDIDIAAGEYIVLAGPSGSGKSTLLNLLGSLDRPTAGTIQLDGIRTTDLGRSAAALFRLRHIGFVFQAYNLLPVLSAYENAEYTIVLQGVPKSQRHERVLGLLDRVGLAELADRRPHELSGGQQQRVAVVRAIAPEPKIVLADEPTANLDSEASASLLDLMAELNAEHGTTFVFATHDTEVMARARRLVRIHDGRIVEDDPQHGG